MPTVSLERYEKKVRKVIQAKNFILTKDDEQLFRERLNNGRRYFYMVLPRNEEGKIVSRFLKVPAQNTKKVLQPFARQIEIGDYLKKHDIILTRGMIDFEIDPKKGIPFAVMETLPSSKIGFIEGNRGTELLNETHAKNVITALERYYSVNYSDLPEDLRKNLKPYKSDYGSMRREMLRILNKKIKNHFDAKGEERFSDVIGRRLGIQGMKKKVLDLFERVRPVIFAESNSGKYLVHGDMAPNNLYVYDNDDIELLDLEWAGVSGNRAISAVIDFGNLRGRAWVNEAFRNALDKELLDYYAKRGEDELGKCIVSLAILRSHLMLSGFFENYEREKQSLEEEKKRREVTEKDVLKAWKVLGIELK